MKIFFITRGLPTNNDPQWGCFELDQARALVSLGHEVVMLYVDNRFRLYWRNIGISITKENGISYCGIYVLPGKIVNLFSHVVKLRFRAWQLMIVYKKAVDLFGKPDIIYAHYMANIASAVNIKHKYNIPLVGIEHWSELTKDVLSSNIRKMGKVAYSGVDCLLAVSQSLQFHIKRHFGIESTVVYDMLGEEFVFSRLSIEKSSRFRFIAVGSLFVIKNYQMLIDAFAKSRLADEGCTMIIVGDGPERLKLEKTIKELNLDEKVSLLGRKTKDEIVNILAESHVFVLSSEKETFGVACIEALSQGLPAIATRCGGPEEFINESNGLLVEPNNSDSMASAMRKIFVNYSEYDTKAIAESCRNRFAPSVIAKQLIEIFENSIK